MQTKYHGLRALTLMGTLLASATMTAGSAQAQQEGLVNVNIQNVTVQIPVGVAANICDVALSALAQAITMGPTQCQSGTIALANDSDGEAPPVDQSGLINVNIQNVDAQVPISVAANICGIAVNVLASDLGLGPVDCNAFGRSATVSS